MPLNRPALRLGPGPRGVQDARRWVVQACADIGRPDLCECAELGVSELVTNALLHGAAPILVGLRGTPEHPRIEVRDSSTDRPVLPTDAGSSEDDGLLLTFGRGLSIVARSADAWGADLDDDGKVVWFAPATQFSDGRGVEGLVTGDPGLPAEAAEDVENPVTVRVHEVPLDTYVAFQQHFRELRREVRLLALAHQSDYPLAQSLSDLFSALDRQLRASVGAAPLETAAREGRSTADLDMVLPRASAAAMERFLEVLDLADEFCRSERLLSLSRTPEQHRFQRWFLLEFVRQGRGEPPRPWSDVNDSATAVDAANAS